MSFLKHDNSLFPGENPQVTANAAVSSVSEDRRLLLLVLSRVTAFRPGEKYLLSQRFKDYSVFLKLSAGDLSRLLGRGLRPSSWEPVKVMEQAEQDLENLTAGSLECIFLDEERYPAQLREIADPPVLLYYRGSIPDFGSPLVAIVGTRYPTGAARDAAFQLGRELSSERVSVISGLARGIDSEAHSGSLRGPGTPMAVLGNGLAFIYPSSSAGIGREIIKRGGVIFSEYPPESCPLRHHFPARNRILSGMARSVVVVQAPESSGALITADYALDEGRDLYVHRKGLSGMAGRGSRNLVGEGAAIIDGADDIFHDWGWDEVKKHLPGIESEYPGKKLANMLKQEITTSRSLRGEK